MHAKRLKELAEKRVEVQKKMNDIIAKAEAEERAMTEEEGAAFDGLEEELRGIDRTIKSIERARDLELNVVDDKKKDELRAEEQEEAEERAFAAFIRDNQEELRAGEIQLTQGGNGSIVPTTIANRIIAAVRDMVPYMTICDVISTNGKLSVPVYGEDETNYISADYVDEGTDLVDNVGKFTTIDLGGYVIGALSLVSNKLVNNTDIDVVSFVINKVAEAMAEKLELEFTTGTTNIKGVITTERIVEAASATSITYDELVSVKHKIKQRFRKNAVWIMHPDTYTALCKLKDNNGQPYFKEDEYKILGCKVYESDSMPTIESGKKSIIFMDPKGYTIKATKKVEITLLREKFSTKNMLGVLAFGEYDANITDTKRISALQQA